MTTNESEIYVKPDQGESYSVLGDLYTIKVQSAATLGAYGLLEVVFQPQGGAPPHYHEQENESFYILEGEIEFQVAEKTYIASAGSFVHIPKGKIHSFINKCQTPVKALVWVTPGGLEKFFAEVGTKVEDPLFPPLNPADMERLPRIAANYGLQLITTEDNK